MQKIEELRELSRRKIIEAYYKVVLILFIAEVFISLLLCMMQHNFDSSFANYVIGYIIVPSCANALVVFITDNLNKHLKSSEVKNPLVVLCLFIICFNMATVHSLFITMYAAFVAPIVVSCLLDDIKMIRNSANIAYVFLWISIKCSSYFDKSWDTSIRVTNGFVASIFIFIVYLICYNLCVFESKKNSVLEDSFVQQKELKKKMETDVMTGLWDHTKFYTVLSKSLIDKDLSTVVVLDIDDFKKVNDTYGHSSGDVVLKQIARILKDVEAKSFRYGGEEFALIFTDFDKMRVFEEMEKVRARVNRLKFGFNPDLVIGVSIGIYQCDKDDSSAEAVFELADTAMYTAKRNGKNQCVMY